MAGKEPRSHLIQDSRPSVDGPFACTPDFSEIKGQECAKRALEVAAAGRHNVLILGPAASGKTLLAHAVPSILPGLSDEAAAAATNLYKASGLLAEDAPPITGPPIRGPRPNISLSALLGGGPRRLLGEVSLSRGGVLFLDGLPDFDIRVLDALCETIEDRAFSTNGMLVCAALACRCGSQGDPARACACSEEELVRYHKGLAGRLLTLIDVFVHVPKIEDQSPVDNRAPECSDVIRQRVVAARCLQGERLDGEPIQYNANMTPFQVRRYCLEQLDEEAQALLRPAIKQLRLSAHAFHRLLKVARTIADLAGSQTIGWCHVAEALEYRQRRLV